MLSGASAVVKDYLGYSGDDGRPKKYEQACPHASAPFELIKIAESMIR
jgi:hypothetical protein